jgi:hypothetical protein
MSMFDVTIRNISVDIRRMKIARGVTKRVQVTAANIHEAQEAAIRQHFPGCRMFCSDPYGTDGTQIGPIVSPTRKPNEYNVYGDALVYTELAS